MWNLEEELVLKVWNLEKNSFLMWNLETTTSENELMWAEFLPSGVSKLVYTTTTTTTTTTVLSQVDVIHN
jgi:hypothetical protein